jgi:hypothetical protein
MVEMAMVNRLAASGAPNTGGLIYFLVVYAIGLMFAIWCVLVPRRVQSWQLRLRARRPFLASFDPSIGFMRHPLYPVFLRSAGIIFVILTMFVLYLLRRDYCGGADNLFWEILGDRGRSIGCFVSQQLRIVD